MLAPTIWDDPDLGKLTSQERLLFIGLISFADDYGHVSGDPAILRRWVFGYDDVMTQQVALMRDHITAICHNVVPYQHEGQDYLWLRKWERHQDLRFRATGQYPCHNCGKFHTSQDYQTCVDLPPVVSELRKDYARTTQDITQVLPPDYVTSLRREEKSREEKTTSEANASVAPKARAKPTHPNGKSELQSQSETMYAALVSAFGKPETDSERGRYNKAGAELRRADPPVLPENIPKIKAAYESRWSKIDCTPTAIAANLSILRGERNAKTSGQPERNPNRAPRGWDEDYEPPNT